jgi:transcriptional accessory protein Tex/SPT6
MNQLLKSLVFSVFVAVSGLAAASPINVNTATQSELESIKGIGPSKAKTLSRCQRFTKACSWYWYEICGKDGG